MVILIVGSAIFLGFGLGFATMALLDARHHRRQCEKEKATCGYSPAGRITRRFRPGCQPPAPHANFPSCLEEV